MMNAVKPRVRRLSIRIAGVAAIIAGCWCCWLTLSPVPDAAEPEAFRDWNAPQPIEAAAANGTSQPPRRLNAEITDVTPVAAAATDDEDAAVIFAEFERHPDETPAIEPVGHRQKEKTPGRAARKSNEVWLTGTIEDDEPSETSRVKPRPSKK